MPPARRGDVHARGRAAITACIRCRQKKKRCDQRLPKCCLCDAAGEECLAYDIATKRRVPRSYTHSLEQRVAYLESKLRQQKGDDQELATPQSPRAVVDSLPNTPSLESAVLGRDVSAAVASVRGLTQRGPEPEPTYAQLFLDELMRSRMTSPSPKCPSATSDLADESSRVLNNLDTRPVSLPTREAAQTLVKVYFQTTSIGMPLLHQPTFEEKLARLYELPRTVNFAEVHTAQESRMAVFFVFEVFAVAILSMQKQDPSRIPIWMADRYHQTAVRALREAGIPNSVEGVQALLAIGQYSYHHPTLWAVWKTVGSALRLSIELGLHEDCPNGDLDPLTLDARRRTFWVAYAMDRNISIVLSMPSCVSDGAISAKFPSEVEDVCITRDGIATTIAHSSPSKRISLHLFRYRQIQSEMRTALYERPPPQCAPVDLSRWQRQMHRQIDLWYQTTPADENFNDIEKGVVKTLEVTYHTALLFLYRPSPNIPSPSSAQLLAMSHAAADMIQLYRQFFRERLLTIYWLAVENVYSAGISLLFGYAHSGQVREQMTLRFLEARVHTCSCVLWGMVEHFPAFQGKRDAFDLAASKVLDNLRSSRQEGTVTAGETSFGNAEGPVSVPRQQASDCVGDRTASGQDEQALVSHPVPADQSSLYTDFAGFPFVSFDDSLSFLWETTATNTGYAPSAWI
ncbi:hypothetical protein P170DRAFT_433416 [Aspergillus steynii IBT 23096]|uniref:Zn(2)-C6 fungal-type domain-containing protein n=1 Tax=Aspergillus steynii IBT 23096 TaxID=1392250 RepID=A0A2I2GEU7_9EURO|nr:uncharacterized protein P170DRAFT_433416 [Aspergillus steynii IBT 23096]PLB51406.1 hypothetical protein P170DRAFT_433416 [Aspergillus steynii IBT 23096]